MALGELERKRIEKALEAYHLRTRPPVHIRPKLDTGFRVSGQSVELFEVRPRWDKPNELLELPFAKATFVKGLDLWKVFWARADGKWHDYPPSPTVRDVAAFLQLVEEDEHHCFGG